MILLFEGRIDKTTIKYGMVAQYNTSLIKTPRNVFTVVRGDG